MKILFATSEAAPFAKSGGLGDVAAALPRQLSKIQGNEVVVFMPYYKCIKENNSFDIEYVTCFYMPLAWRSEYVGLFKTVIKNTGVGKNKRNDLTIYFVDNEHYFKRDGLYGHGDDGERFAYFSKAVLESLQHIKFYPDVIHSNDWQTGFIPLYLKALYSGLYPNTKTVFTIHNIEYQGKADMDFIDEVLGVDCSYLGAITFDNLINATKAAVVLADKVTTVSRTYSYEIQYDYFGHGLAGVLSQNSHKLCGIVNGIDADIYDPSKCKDIAANYKPTDLSGKAKCKEALQKELGLEVCDKPIVAMITRLVSHKGVELLEYIGEDMINSLDIQLIILGTGDSRFENYVRYLGGKYPSRVSANIKFDGALSNRIYAGADLFLMPSKSEACGLAQLISMRFGTIPIVHETGGLVDTVPPINPETLEGKGITFKGFNAHDMKGAVKRGIDIINDKKVCDKIRANIMRPRNDWKASAAEYQNIYLELTGK